MVNMTLPVLTLFSMFYIFGWFRVIFGNDIENSGLSIPLPVLWILNNKYLLTSLFLLFIFIRHHHTVNIIIITIVVLLLLLLSLSSSSSLYLVILLFVHYLCINFCVHLYFCPFFGMQVHDLSSEKYLEPSRTSAM